MLADPPISDGEQKRADLKVPKSLDMYKKICHRKGGSRKCKKPRYIEEICHRVMLIRIEKVKSMKLPFRIKNPSPSLSW